jgi:three-Cys-motif partner protein
MPFDRRDAQSRIKHEILSDYVGAWAGIISQGLRRKLLLNSDLHLDLVYLDGFAGYGRYARDADKTTSSTPIWGSPILALRALETAAEKQVQSGLRVRVTGLLVEKDPSIYEELHANLEAARLVHPVVEAKRFDRLALGTISVLHGDFRAHLQDILKALGSEAFLMAFVDPYGTTMPTRLLQLVVARPKTDAITLFPVYEVHKNAGSARKPASERGEQDWNNIQRNTDHLGDDRWLEVAMRDDPDWESHYVELYREKLLNASPGLLAKNIGLQFASRGVPGYHLFLTTRNPDGALRINTILRRAEFRKHWTLWSDRETRERDKRSVTGELELDLGVPYAPEPTVQEPEVDPAEVDRTVQACLTPGSYVLRTILGWTSDSVYTREEILAALRRLKKKGTLTFTELKTNNSRVVIPSN